MIQNTTKKITYMLLIACVLGSTTTYALLKPLDARLENKKEIEETRLASSSKKEMVADRVGSTTEIEKNGLRGQIVKTIKDAREEIIKIRTEQIRKVGVRLQATAERLQSILNRVLSRIEKIKNAGGTATEAEKYVAEAQASLDKAKQNIITLSGMLGNDKALATTTKKVLIDPAKKLTNEIQSNLTQAQKSLAKAIKSLMGNKLNTESASTTDKTNN